MKLTLNQKFEYTLFGLSNLFFATPWGVLMAIIALGAIFSGSTGEHTGFAIVIVWLLLIALKFTFVEISYKRSKNIRAILDKVHSVWQLLGVALAIDIGVLGVQLIIEVIVMKDSSQLASSCTNLLLMYLPILGGVTPSYLFFALRKKHIKIEKPAESDE